MDFTFNVFWEKTGCFFPYSALEEVLIVLRAATEGKIHKNFSKTTEIWLLWFYSFYAKTDIYSKNICL